MIVTGNDHFLSICKRKLVEWYNEAADAMSVYAQQKIDLSNVYVVWCCKTLQNYKALLSTSVSGDGIYVEANYNHEILVEVRGNSTVTGTEAKTNAIQVYKPDADNVTVRVYGGSFSTSVEAFLAENCVQTKSDERFIVTQNTSA